MIYENLETLMAMQQMSLLANFLGFNDSEQLIKKSYKVMSSNLGLVGFLVDLTTSNFPSSTYRIAFYDQFLEEHVQLFFNEEDAVKWLSHTYSEFSVEKN